MSDQVGITAASLDRWVAALRSGKYPQGAGRLRGAEGYCCLGVLCELEGVDLDDPTSEGAQMTWASGGGVMIFPPALAVLRLVDRTELAHLNDHGVSFAAIADYIEEHRFEIMLGRVGE